MMRRHGVVDVDRAVAQIVRELADRSSGTTSPDRRRARQVVEAGGADPVTLLQHAVAGRLPLG